MSRCSRGRPDNRDLRCCDERRLRRISFVNVRNNRGSGLVSRRSRILPLREVLSLGVLATRAENTPPLGGVALVGERWRLRKMRLTKCVLLSDYSRTAICRLSFVISAY